MSFVVVPMSDGELGVASGHSPMIGRLGYGELRLKNSEGGESRYYVDGGFVQIASNEVSILTGRLLTADQIDVDAVKEQAASDKMRDRMTLGPHMDRGKKGGLRTPVHLVV